MKRGMILTLTLLSVLAMLPFVSSAVTVVSPVNGSNHTTTALFNVTFINSTDMLIRGTDATNVNASFYSISGATRTLITNSSTCAVSSGTTFACWTVATLTSSNDGFFNITAQIFNVTNFATNASINTTSIYIDNTPPAVQEANFTSPLSGKNYSDRTGFLELNVSVIDATIGIQALFFNITNASGYQNATVYASNPTGNIWNASINTTAFPDGTYNITVYANDTLNNLNDSAIIYSVIFDNTPPVMSSFSCSPNPVAQGSTTTCGCAGTDAGSGLNTSYAASGFSFDANPSTAQTGQDFPLTCTAQDNVGWTSEISTSYTVTSGGGGGGGGGSGGGSTWTTTYPVGEDEFSQGYEKSLKEKQRLKLPFGNDVYHYVGVKTITPTTVTITVQSDPIDIELSVGEVEKVEVTGDDYYDVEITLESIDGSKANIIVKEIHELKESPPEQESTETDQGNIFGDDTSPSSSTGTIFLIVIVILIILAIIFYFNKNRSLPRK